MGDMRRTRFGDIKAMLVMGAKDGALPSRPSDDGLLSDDDRHILEDAGMKLAVGTVGKIYEEEFLIFANISKPSEFLSLSYPMGNLEGQAANPARLLSRVRELFPKISADNNDLLDFSNAQGAMTDLALALGKKANYDIPLPAKHLQAYAYFAQSDEYADKIANMQKGMRFSQSHAKSTLSKQSVQDIYKQGLRTSVSKLGRYISCPFAYFAQYNLAAKPRQIHDVAAVDMGNIYHDILSKFGETLKNLDASTDDARIEVAIDSVVDEVFASPANFQLRSSGRYMYFADKMRRISQSSALALTTHLSAGKFNVAYNEVAFDDMQKGEDYTLSPIEIDLSPSAKMLLQGRIDRVDIAAVSGADYVKIIDYKSGTKQFSLEEVYYGLDMQLLVYLGAFVSQVAEEKGESTAKKILPAAAFYFNLLNPLLDFDEKLEDEKSLKKGLLDKFKMSGIVMDDDEVLASVGDASSYKKSSALIPAGTFAKLLNHVMKLAKQAGSSILAGDISISPHKLHKNTACSHCNYHPICKFDKDDQDAHRHLAKLNKAEVIEKLEN